MTAHGAAVRRALARVCSTRTMERLVDPILSDMQVESDRPRWRGYVALAGALALDGLHATRRVCANVWAEDGLAAASAAGFSVGAALLLSIVMTLSTLADLRLGTHAPWLALMALLLPQASGITLPAGLLFGLPMALKRRPPSRRDLGRTAAVALCFTAAAFALIAWIVPESNQGFRVLVSGRPQIRGPNELSFAAISDQIRTLSTFHGGEMLVRQLALIYHVRIALACSALPLGLLSLGLWGTRAGRRHSIQLGVVVAVAYLWLAFWLNGVFKQSSVVPVVLLAWTPNIVVSAVALALLTRQREPITAPPASA